LRQLYKIARLEEASEKLAGEGAGASATALLKLSLWTQMKAAAVSDRSGQAVGLAKMAARIGHESALTTQTSVEPLKTASAQERVDLDLLAVGFASALAVDKAIDADSSLSEKDAQALHELNAESAVDDLLALAKTAAPAWLSHPATIGAGIGGLGGAALGAWGDQESPGRGALMGGLGGAAVGGIGGLAVQQWRNAAALEAEMIKKLEAEKLHQVGDSILKHELQRQNGLGGMRDIVSLQKQMLADADPAHQAAVLQALEGAKPVDMNAEMIDALHEMTLKQPTPTAAGIKGMEGVKTDRTFHAPEAFSNSSGHAPVSKK
jgi:hypothetical protein